MDLKAVCDRIDREKLWRIMEEKGINNKMIGRVKKMYENTEVMVRINEGIQEDSERGRASDRDM